MQKKSFLFKAIILIMLFLLAFTVSACQEVEEDDGPIYGINDDESNQVNKDKTEKKQAIEKVTNSITNLKKRLNSEDVGEGGYYMAFDFHINTANNSNFVMRLQAHLFTYPYMNEYGVIREDDLKKHNELIKKSTILLEWYDGITNSMLIGFYFDGVKANPNDPGNILYLNLQGEKRWFPDFGDSVLYQQMIRLITSFSLDDVLKSAGVGEDGGVSAIYTLLDLAITNNYKLVLNHNEQTNKDVTSVLFNSVNLDIIKEDLTNILQNIFSPFGNKIDPLTNKYLGFKFSTLGRTSLQTINSDMQFFIEPDTDGVDDILTSAYVFLAGSAQVDNVSIPFTSDIRIYYGAAPPKPIQLDKEFYKYYDYGKYEFTGNLYLPTMDLNLDALIRTKVNEYDNTINHVFSEFRDIANGDLIIGAYYKNELAYLDIEGLQHLYGGIKIEDIGFPKVYIEGWDLAKMLKNFFDMVDNTIVSIVDSLLDPADESEKSLLLEVIMAKMESTEKNPDDPLSKNTVMIRLDHELLKNVLREGGYGTFTTRDLIDIMNAQLPITLDELATILGITSAEILIEKTWIKITLDVDTNEIRIQLYSDIGLVEGEEPSKMLMQLDLVPVKIGEDMVIAEISFDDFNELLPVYTYSAEMSGQFLFSNAERVDMSELLSSFMDDISGKNTPYVLPMETKLDFTLYYDQYIKEQRLQKVPGGPRDGRWTAASRNAFILNVFIKGATEADNTTLFNIYANDVSFKSNAPEEELGYIWIDFVCLRNDPNVQSIPKFKIREDYWLQSINRYMNQTEAGENVDSMLNPDISLSITTIISALVEDSFVVFQPDQIEITTSNETVQNLFGVKSLIGNIGTQVGLVQRVFGVDEIEDEFAHYTVAELTEISARGPYTTRLHDSIDVTFTFNQNGRTWNEVVPMKFEYDPATIEVSENPIDVYHPEIYGPIIISETVPKFNRFMGVQRSYTIRMTGGATYLKKIRRLNTEDFYDVEEDLVITAADLADRTKYTEEEAKYIRENYMPHLRLEPREPLPEALSLVLWDESIYDTGYATNIIIDWENVTLQGGAYLTEVVIAEGMMGETVFPIFIIVTNRVVDTTGQNPKVVNVTANPNSDELTEAPVVDTINIDPYDYLWAKAAYLKKNMPKVFENPQEKELARQLLEPQFRLEYFGSFNIEIRFVDFDPDAVDYRDTPNYNGGLPWYFDRYIPTQYYDETDIVLTGGSTYMHADFHGQIVALKLNILPRTIRGIYFDGEEENDVYTVDMLDESTYDIPLYPTIVFEEKDEGDRYITKKLYDAINDIYVPMIWSNPRVTNPAIAGTDTPFLGTTSNLTSSYIDLYRALEVGEWIFKEYSPIRTVRVDCPPKEIAELDSSTHRMGYSSLENWNSDTQELIVPSYISIGSNPSGFYHVDPFNPQTAKLPGAITVTFKGRLEGDPNYTKNYVVNWEVSSGLVEYVASGNYYRLTVNSDDEKYLKLTTSVGNDIVGYIEITLCVKILTSHYTDITFYDVDGVEMTMEGDASTGYIYKVNTYAGFRIPHSFGALFGESDIRYYYTDWKGKDLSGEYVIPLSQIRFQPGNVIELITTLPGGNNTVLEVRMTVNVENLSLENIIFTNIPMWRNADGVLVKLPLTLRLSSINDFTLDGIRINTEGKIENLYFGRGFYENIDYNFTGINVPFIEGVKDEWGNYIQQPVQPVALYPYELLTIIFQNACLVFDNREKLIKDLSIENLKGIMNTQDIVQKTGDTMGFNYGDGKYIIRLGQGAGAHDLLIRIKFIEGIFALAGTELQTHRIQLYNPNGSAIWGVDGFILGDNISASVDASIQATQTPITFQYGPQYGENAPRLNEWYVETSNIALMPAGSYITKIPIEVLYNSGLDISLEISYLTEQGFRLKRNINIVKVNFGNLYRSVASYNDLFEIVGGRIVINDLYEFNPLNLYLSSPDYLPKTINRSTSMYDITVSDIVWTIHDDWRYFLNNHNYKGDDSDIRLATASILGWYETVPNQYGVPERVYHDRETITLYIRVESAEVVSLPLEQTHGLKTSHSDIVVTSSAADEEKRERIQELFNASTAYGDYYYREFIINVDAYRNSNYQGLFIPPANLSVKFQSGITHTFSSLRYMYRGVEIADIRYGIDGIIYYTDNDGDYIMIGSQKVHLMKGDNKYNITLSVNLGAGQTIATRIHFYDKTVVAVRPVIDYNDEEIRSHIAAELSELMDAIKAEIQGNINLTKLEYEIGLCLDVNSALKEGVNKKRISSELKRLDLASIASGAAREVIFGQLNQKPTLYTGVNPDEPEKIIHNYVANILIAVFDDMSNAGADAVLAQLAAYLAPDSQLSFADVESVVDAFFNEVYNESARLVINNKIVDFVEPQVMYELQQMDIDQQIYLIKLKNDIEAELNINALVSAINAITDTNLQSVRNAIRTLINDEFTRMLSVALAASNDTEELKNAVNTKLLARKEAKNADLTTLRDKLADILLGTEQGNIKNLIEGFFADLFYFVEDNYAMTIAAVRQEIERTISNLVVEMRASVAAGLAINTGGRLGRAINLSVAEAINNVMVEGRIIDAMKLARNLNVMNLGNGQFAIDPYGDYIYVPSKTEIIFSENNGGDSYIVNINWSKPANWSTPRNPNAGVTYAGNEGNMRDAMSSAWEILYAEITQKAAEVAGSEDQLSIEEDLLYRNMNAIITAIYMQRFGTANLNEALKSDGWLALFGEISEAELLAIKTRVQLKYPGATGTQLNALCFDMWAHINAWTTLKDYIVENEVGTPEDEWEIWESMKPGFARRELALYRNEFTSTLYSEGIASQDLSLIIFVHDRRLDSGNWNLYNDETSCSKTDPLYHIADPFAGRVADFPNLINLDEGIIINGNLVQFSDLAVNWDFSDQAISYSGSVVINQNTGKMGIIVRGYIKNSRVGQEVTLRLVVNAWEYNATSGSGLRQYSGPEGGDIHDTNNYTIMNPISFVFSKLVDYSAQNQYEVMIKETQYRNEIDIHGEIVREWTETVYKNVLFYPEDSRLIRSSIDDAEMEEIQQKRNYILYWDAEAKNMAYNSGGVPITGSFSLGNAHKNKLTRANSATYRYEESYISQVNATDYTVEGLKEWYIAQGNTPAAATTLAEEQYQRLYGTTGAAMLILNPTDPMLPATVKAIGTLNQMAGTDLGNVRVLWNRTLTKAKADLTAYIKYMYPTLTNNEAEKAAMELLIDTGRSQAQQQELIANIVEWQKIVWQQNNNVQFTQFDDESWGIYLNHSSTSPATRTRMNNLLDTITKKQGNRVTVDKKFEGWYRMYMFLYIRSQTTLYTEDEKANIWDSKVQMALDPNELLAMIARIEEANPTLTTIELKALAYDEYVKTEKWTSLMLSYSGHPALTNELNALLSAMASKYPLLNSYEVRAKSWDAYSVEFENEDIVALDALREKVAIDNPSVETNEELSAIAWDRWLKGEAFRAWFEKEAKAILCVEESYDVQTAPGYLDGGIDGTKTVTLLLQLTKGGYIYTQTFKIRLLFLDLSPLQYYLDQNGTQMTVTMPKDAPLTQLSIAVKTDYNHSTDYVGGINPYDSRQQMVFDMLDYFAGEEFEGSIITKTIGGKQVNVKILTITNINWNIPANSGSGSVVYSSSFTIGNVTYQSNLLRMVLA